MEEEIQYMFAHAFLKLMILNAVRKEKYPYAILKSIKEHGHPMTRRIKKSDVYNQISSLEKEGFIRSKGLKDGKRYYELTMKGSMTLRKASQVRKRAFMAILELIGGRA